MSDGRHGCIAGGVGIWAMELRFGDPGLAADAAAELETMGYGAIWIPGGIGGDVLGDIARLAGATRQIAYATAILNIYRQDADYVAGWWAAADDGLRARTMLGVGVSHAPLIGDAYRKPLAAIGDYLDAMDKAGIPAESRCVAAQGPKMLALAAARSAGAHPYLVTPEHTAAARATMGPDAMLAPEQGVILETDPAVARDLARDALANYAKLPNYANSWLRLGYTQDDVTGLSDRLIDGLFAWGSVEAVADRVRTHHAAGADHVALQVIHAGTKAMTPPVDEWRTLAEALL